MTALFKDIEDCLAKVPHGWCSVPKALTLASIIVATRPKVVCEIGVWAGRSLLPMGLAAKEIGCCEVIGIDPWLPSESRIGQEGDHLTWWGSVDHEQFYHGLLVNIGEMGLGDVVKIIRSKSDDVDPPKNAGLLHVDGNHGPQSIRDVERFAPNVPVGGFVFADDLNWAGGSVAKSVEKLVEIGFKECYRLDTGALYQRIK